MFLLNNSKFSDSSYLIYPNEKEIKDTTESRNTATYLDLQFKFDHQPNLHTWICNKLELILLLLIFHIWSAIHMYTINTYLWRLCFTAHLLSWGCFYYKDFSIEAKSVTAKFLLQQFCVNNISHQNKLGMYIKESLQWIFKL